MPPHIDKMHEDMIPEGYTALRITFNVVNNKEKGSCIICKQETAWNENKGRYERLCGRKECAEAYKNMAHKRNQDIYGTDDPTQDPRYKEEIQKRALARRKIAGSYRFSDGGTVEFVGQYERKLLEFMDKVMHINSCDIVSPGPSIIYKFEGVDHLYMPDFLYIPYNLIIEVKDGGSNPDKNPTRTVSREKTIAKEEAIIKQGKYNYLRLTDNDFSQLMEAFAILKYQLLENTEQQYVKINESFLIESSVIENMMGAIGSALAPNPIPHESNPGNYMMVQHIKNDKISYGITNDPQCNEFISVDIDNGFMVHKTTKSEIDHKYTTFKMKDSRKAKEIYDEAVEMLKIGAKVDSTDYFYRRYTCRKLLTHDQIAFDENFEQVSFDAELKSVMEQVENFIRPDKLAEVENEMKLLERKTYERG